MLKRHSSVYLQLNLVGLLKSHKKTENNNNLNSNIQVSSLKVRHALVSFLYKNEKGVLFKYAFSTLFENYRQRIAKNVYLTCVHKQTYNKLPTQ